MSNDDDLWVGDFPAAHGYHSSAKVQPSGKNQHLPC